MPDASHRRTVPEDAVLWESADDGLAHARGVRSEPQACAAVDAADGYRGDLSASADDGNCRGTPEIPVSFARAEDHDTGRSVGGGHHVHPDAERVHVLGGDHRLVQPVRAGLAVVEQSGEQLLYGCVGGGVVAAPAGNLQHGSRGSVHKPGVHRPNGGGRREWLSASLSKKKCFWSRQWGPPYRMERWTGTNTCYLARIAP